MSATYTTIDEQLAALSIGLGELTDEQFMRFAFNYIGAHSMYDILMTDLAALLEERTDIIKNDEDVKTFISSQLY